MATPSPPPPKRAAPLDRPTQNTTAAPDGTTPNTGADARKPWRCGRTPQPHRGPLSHSPTATPPPPRNCDLEPLRITHGARDRAAYRHAPPQHTPYGTLVLARASEHPHGAPATSGARDAALPHPAMSTPPAPLSHVAASVGQAGGHVHDNIHTRCWPARAFLAPRPPSSPNPSRCCTAGLRAAVL